MADDDINATHMSPTSIGDISPANAGDESSDESGDESDDDPVPTFIPTDSAVEGEP